MNSKEFLQSIVLAVILFMLISTVSAQTFPATPAGSRAKEIMDLFNQKTSLTPKAYVDQNCTETFKQNIPEESRGSAIVQIRNMTNEVELVSIEKNEPGEIGFTICSTSNGLCFSISLTVDEREPCKIETMRFAPAGHSRSAKPLSDHPEVLLTTEKIREIREYLRQQAVAGQFSGTALVAEKGNPVLIESAGMASKRYQAPNKSDTKYNLGSLNKSFTSVSILQLVEAGKIGIDDPIGKYLDLFPNEISETVTIRQLLNMSNGWGDYWQNRYFLEHKDNLRTLADYMTFIRDIPLDFEPGTKTQHSNIGFEVAGAIIEKVSGMDYFDYIRKNIYQPAGMVNSDSYDRDSPVENMATGYTNHHQLDTLRKGWQWENTYILAPRGTPAGGGYSTVEDMLKYDNAIRSGKILGSPHVDFMSNGYKGNIGNPVEKTLNKGAGGAAGVSTFYARDWKNGISVVVLTNIDHPVAPQIGDEILKIMGVSSK